jgi:hypothetical protein
MIFSVLNNSLLWRYFYSTNGELLRPLKDIMYFFEVQDEKR